MGLNSNKKMINSTTCHCCSLDVFESIIKNKSIRLCDMRNSNIKILSDSEITCKVYELNTIWDG